MRFVESYISGSVTVWRSGIPDLIWSMSVLDKDGSHARQEDGNLRQVQQEDGQRTLHKSLSRTKASPPQACLTLSANMHTLSITIHQLQQALHGRCHINAHFSQNTAQITWALQ